MAINFTSDVFGLYATNIAADADYASPGNFNLPGSTAGAVASVTITNAGSGYTLPPGVTFSSGGGSGAAGTAVMTATGIGTTFTVTADGTGYTAIPTATIAGGGGTGGTATVSLKAVAVTIAAGGTGYGASQTFTASVVGGTGTATQVSVTSNGSGVVTTVNSISVAGNYTVLPTLSGVATTGGAGTGLTLNLVMGVSALTRTAAGSGYTALPTVTISGGGGTGGTATATLTATTVASITITNGGDGFETPPTVGFTGGGGGSAAAGTAVLNGTRNRYLLLFVELFRSYVATMTSKSEVKTATELLGKMMQEMKAGGATLDASVMALRVKTAALRHMAKQNRTRL